MYVVVRIFMITLIYHGIRAGPLIHLLRCSPVYRATATTASLVDDAYSTAPSTAAGKKVGIVVDGNATAE